MKRVFKFLVISLAVVLAVTSCQTTNVENVDLTINGKAVKFDLDGGEFLPGELLRAQNENKEDFVNLPSAAKEGYEFLGWIDESSDSQDAVLSVERKSVKKAKNYKASWNVVEYTVSFDTELLSSDGGKAADLPVIENASYTIETGFRMDAEDAPLGYEFVGYVRKGESIDNAEKTISLTSGNCEYTALFKASTYTVTIDYDREGVDDALLTYTYKSSDEVEIKTPEINGLIFKDWTGDIEALKEKDDETFVVDTLHTGDISINAEWEYVEYSIFYVNRFAESISRKADELPSLSTLISAPGEYNVDDTFTIGTPEAEGYVFLGWIEDGKEEKDAQETFTLPLLSTGDKTLVALWKPELYKITYDYNGVEGPQGLITSYSYRSGEKIEIKNPERNAYIFCGWECDDSDALIEGDGYVLINTSHRGDISIKALWTPENYPIKYDLDGIIIDDMVVEEPVVESVVVEEKKNRVYYTTEDSVDFVAPTRVGFDFLGWVVRNDETGEVDIESANPDYTIAVGSYGDKNLVAVWSRNVYKLTYDYNYGTVEEENPSSFVYGAGSVKLSDAERDYFTFLGWMDSESGKVYKGEYDGTSIDRDVHLVALWEPVQYRITYDLDGGAFALGNEGPLAYTYDTPTFTLPDPVKDGYVFTGWERVVDDTLIPNFNLTFSTDGISLLIRVYDTKSEWVLPEGGESSIFTTALEYLKKEFSDSKVYSSGNVITVENTFSDPTLIKSVIASIAKNIGLEYTYEAPLEKEEEEVCRFTLEISIEDVDLMIKVYDTKAEWVLPEGITEETVEKIISYIESEFKSAEISYKSNIITLKSGDGNSDLLSGIINNITSDLGFIYDYKAQLEEANGYKNIVIEKCSNGDREYRATWQIVTYTIKYGEEEAYAQRFKEEAPSDPTEYTVLDEKSLQNREKFGYDFMGWVEENEEYTEAKVDLVIEKGSHGDKVYIPLFKLHDYSVSLDLDGGHVDSPLSFTIEDDSFVIPEAERDNCVFLGWLLEDGSVKKEVTVNPKEGKDVVLKALWEAVDYTIEYDLGEGAYYVVGGGVNPTSYNALMDSFTLINPVKDTYEFIGWVEEERENVDLPVVDYLFDTTKGGDYKFKAEWKEKEYKMSYDLDGGSFDWADSNPDSFTNYTESFSIVSPKKTGYIFLGWVESGKEGNKPQVNYVIDTENLRSDVSLKALWSIRTYGISYDLDGGYYARGTTPNPGYYTILDKIFLLSNPQKDGYTFLGWVRSEYSDTDNPSLLYIVDTKTGGNLAYTAVWSPVEYNVSYYLDGGEYLYGNSNPETYTSDSSFTLFNPHKDGYTFLGWIRSGDTTESVNETAVVRKGTKGDLSFYAVYEKTLVALGEVTRMQKENVVLGENDIPRPDWVIQVPSEYGYHYEKAYSMGSDFVTNTENAVKKCKQYMTNWISTEISNVTRTVNGVTYTNNTVLENASIENAEMVEYWVDVHGGVWVLMKIKK